MTEGNYRGCGHSGRGWRNRRVELSGQAFVRKVCSEVSPCIGASLLLEVKSKQTEIPAREAPIHEKEGSNCSRRLRKRKCESRLFGRIVQNNPDRDFRRCGRRSRFDRFHRLSLRSHGGGLQAGRKFQSGFWRSEYTGALRVET